MKKTTYPVHVFKQVSVCECGGHLEEPIKGTLCIEDPITMEYKCNLCDKIYTLAETDFPKIIYRPISNNAVKITWREDGN